MSGGWSPTVHLTSHHGGRPVWNEEAIAVPAPRTAAAGPRRGGGRQRRPLARPLPRGRRPRGGRGGGGGPASRRTFPRRPSVDPESTALVPLWRVKNSRGKAFVDFQNDVGASDVALAHREGFRAVEHLKRYTTLGMATDQGKTSNVNGLALNGRRQRALHRRDRHDDVPAALHARCHRGAGRPSPWPRVQADPPDRDA